MQQDEVMSELLEFATANPQDPDRAEILATVKYLSALNDIFERTMLGNQVRIFYHGGPAIQRLNEGFAYFEEWAEELIDSGAFNNGVSTESFLSWQVNGAKPLTGESHYVAI